MRQNIYANRPLNRGIWIKRISIITIILTMLLSLAACKNAPTTPPVVGKQQDLEDKITDNTQTDDGQTGDTQGSPQTKDTPETVQDDFTSGNVTVKIDATLQIPETLKIPVVEVQPEGFGQDMVDKVHEVLMKGSPLFQVDSRPTKSEVRKYALVKIYNSNHQNGQQGGRSSGSSAAPGAEALNEEDLEKAIAKAPESVPKVPTSGELKDTNESDLAGSNGKLYKGFHGKSLYVTANLGTDYNAKLFVLSSTSQKNCLVRFTNLDITSIYTYSSQTGQARGMKTTLDEAKQLARTTLDKLGAADMQLSGVQLGTQVALTEEDDPDKMNQVYGLWFTRSVSEFPVTLDLSDTLPREDEYTESYPYEKVFMIVDDTGVAKLEWTSPAKVTKTISPDAKILPFDKIMETFKKQIFIHYAAPKESSTYTINRITLGLMRLQEKDSDHYMLVPVWDFYGAVSPEDPNGTDHSLISLLTINAIDGSIINRREGH